ncbi:hypothetical protein Z946_98 [Sulfitobacter noctilucicola]|nr:hypothetical protein Z946_98 [Sulfitobacter noctilucicola]
MAREHARLALINFDYLNDTDTAATQAVPGLSLVTNSQG